MKQALCALFLTGCSLIWPAASLPAEETQPIKKEPAEKTGISSEDRQIIKRLELLELMEFLKDMELLEGEIRAVMEEKK